MGIYGLTTYLKQYQRQLCKNLQYPSTDDTTWVIDGWSFVYEVQRRSRLPWIYGGEMREITAIVERIVMAWINLGVKVEFVFDGPAPELKYKTIIQRLEKSNIYASSLLFRTSAAGWSGIARDLLVIPPFAYEACLRALRNISETTTNLVIHVADEESDPACVELAGRAKAYVVGNDSDFAVLNTDRYRGYIPLESMVWSDGKEEEDLPLDQDDDGFKPVAKSKGKKAQPIRTSKLFIPPDNNDDSVLTCHVFKPELLAEHLKIPLSLLPLFGALVGNDYSHISSTMFFPARYSPIQRIERVASALISVLANPKKNISEDAGTELVAATIDKLLLNPARSLGTGKFEAMMENVVEATLKYAIPVFDEVAGGHEILKSPDSCIWHDAEECPLLPYLSRQVNYAPQEEQAEWRQIRDQCLQAYRRAYWAPKLMELLQTGAFWPRIFLESPALETAPVTIGRPVRLLIYSVLDDALGLTEKLGDAYTMDASITFSVNDNQTEPKEDDTDDDELVDVVENDSEEEEWQTNLSTSDAALTGLVKSYTDSMASHRSGSPRAIYEYVRRGERVVPVRIPVTPLQTIMENLEISEIPTHLLLAPEKQRLEFFLRALRSHEPAIVSLPKEQLVAVLAVRHVVSTLHERALERPDSKDRSKERWSLHEARSALAAFEWPGSNLLNLEEYPLPLKRDIQNVAQLCTALESIILLAQALLLTERVPSPMSFFSGSRYHAFAARQREIGSGDLPLDLTAALRVGLGSILSSESAKAKKEKTKVPVKKNAKLKAGFAVLADMAA